MSSTMKVALIVGTRPEGIKLAPLARALREQGAFQPLLVSTGQHREMLSQALAAFDLRPDVDLDVMRTGQTLHDITCRTIARIQHVLRAQRPAWVVVQGDTTTALAAALAAFYERLPVAHVEAGLRSGDRYAPFPEEINRRLVDQLSSAMFAPTAAAQQALLREGFAPDSVFCTGNTVVDALVAARGIVHRDPPAIPDLPAGALEGRRMILVTAHRRESFGAALEGMCRAILRVVQDAHDTCVVYPVHLNPNVAETVQRVLGGHPRVFLLRPVTYLQFVALMDRAHLILTDSGGVQEEAPTFRKPLLVMREVTERPEGVAAGVARLVGTSEDRIHGEAMTLLTSAERYQAMASGVNPYGDGRAARRIAYLLERLLDAQRGAGRAPADGLGGCAAEASAPALAARGA